MATENLDPNGGEKFLNADNVKNRQSANRFASWVLIGLVVCIVGLFIDMTIDSKHRDAFNDISVGFGCVAVVIFLRTRR